MRKRIFEIIEPVGISGSDDAVSRFYDMIMIGVIIISLIPLTIKNPSAIWKDIDNACVTVFIIDYILRLLTADYKYDDHSAGSFIRYPFSAMALIDLLSILPSVLAIHQGFKILRLVRMSKALRVFRAFRALRYSKNFDMIITVIKNSKDSLIAVCTLTVAYIFVSALVVFTVEPESFDDFFEAVYWATVSLTTVGYGDVYPVTETGRIVTMISSMFGIAIVALPAGIITAGYIKELDARTRKSDE